MVFKRAFTLIEMLVAISLLLLLIALLMPSIKMARETARRTICLSQMRQSMIATRAYVDETNYMPDGRYYKKPSRYRNEDYSLPYERHVYREDSRDHYDYRVLHDGTISNRLHGRVGMGTLFPDYLVDPHVFWCPSVGPTYEADFQYLSIEDELIPRVRLDYHGVKSVYEVVSTYFYRRKADIRSPVSPQLHQYENPALALLLDATYADIAGPNHLDGFNVVHFDGRGRWQDDEGNSLYVQTGTPNSSHLIEMAIRLADRWSSPTSSGGDQW